MVQRNGYRGKSLPVMSPEGRYSRKLSYHNSSSDILSSSLSIWSVLGMIVATICVFLCGSHLVRQKELRDEFKKMVIQRDELEKNHTILQRRLEETRQEHHDKDTQLEQAIHSFKSQKIDLENLLEEQVKIADRSRSQREALDNEIQEQIANNKKKTASMQKSVQQMAKKQAMEHFGPGPYYVEIEVQLPGEKSSSFFTVQMATLDKMPVSVNLFMHQVRARLWDNTSFLVDIEHITMAQTVSAHGNDDKISLFQQKGLEKVVFPEYHQDYPHTPYTLGFAGDPAGPVWYINKVDNTVPHGPNGNQKYGDPQPCFANIIIGKEVIDRMKEVPHSKDAPYLFKYPVTIVSARMRGVQEVQGGLRYIRQLEEQKSF